MLVLLTGKIERLKQKNWNKNTTHSTNTWVRRFESWYLQQPRQQAKLEEIPVQELDRVPYTRVNKRIRLFQKLQGNMRLIPNMRLIMRHKKLTTPPKLRCCVYMTAYSAGKNNQKALRVDLMFTVGPPKSVSCDAATNIGSCPDKNS